MSLDPIRPQPHNTHLQDLQSLLKDELCYDEKVLSHSFRAGIPSILARRGFSKDVILNSGRWTSDAYQVYCKEGRGMQVRLHNHKLTAGMTVKAVNAAPAVSQSEGLSVTEMSPRTFWEYN